MARAQGNVSCGLIQPESAENFVVARRVNENAGIGWMGAAGTLPGDGVAGIAPSLAALAAFVFFVWGA